MALFVTVPISTEVIESNADCALSGAYENRVLVITIDTRGQNVHQRLGLGTKTRLHWGAEHWFEVQELSGLTISNGSILMGLYGRIRGYGEEGEGETIRSALMRSDDGGDNWEYYSTLAYDAASIIDFEEPALLELEDGRFVCFMLYAHPCQSQ